MIDAKEEIIQSLMSSIKQKESLDFLSENDVRSIIAVLLNNQFDTDLISN